MMDAALRAIEKQTGLSFKLEAEGFLIGINQRVDAVVSLTLPKAEIPLYIEVKKQLSRPYLEELIRLRSTQRNLFLITREVPNQFKAALRSHGIGYADIKGAYFLPVMSGEETVAPRFTSSRTARTKVKPGQLALSPASTSLVFVMLCNPELLNSSQRELAGYARCSLGLVNQTIKALIHHGYLSKLKNKFRMVNKEGLLAIWIEAFNRRARGNLFVGRYSTDLEVSMKKLPNYRDLVTWGGEAAAANMGKLAPPSNYMGYLEREKLPTLQRKLALSPDENGNISFFEKFWDVKSVYEDNGFCHPFLAAADLLSLESERAVEAAESIIKEFSR